MKVKNFYENILLFWISESIGIANNFPGFILQKVINVSCSQYI